MRPVPEARGAGKELSLLARSLRRGQPLLIPLHPKAAAVFPSILGGGRPRGFKLFCFQCGKRCDNQCVQL